MMFLFFRLIPQSRLHRKICYQGIFGDKSSVISCIGQIAVLTIVILVQKQLNQVLTIVG